MAQKQATNTDQSLSEFCKEQTQGDAHTWEPETQRAKEYDARYQQFAEFVGEEQQRESGNA